jgi:hypothetical protein
MDITEVLRGFHLPCADELTFGFRFSLDKVPEWWSRSDENCLYSTQLDIGYRWCDETSFLQPVVGPISLADEASTCGSEKESCGKLL